MVTGYAAHSIFCLLYWWYAEEKFQIGAYLTMIACICYAAMIVILLRGLTNGSGAPAGRA